MITASSAKKYADDYTESNVKEVLDMLGEFIKDAAEGGKYFVITSIATAAPIIQENVLTRVLEELDQLGFTTEVKNDTLTIRWHFNRLE